MPDFFFCYIEWIPKKIFNKWESWQYICILYIKSTTVWKIIKKTTTIVYFNYTLHQARCHVITILNSFKHMYRTIDGWAKYFSLVQCIMSTRSVSYPNMWEERREDLHDGVGNEQADLKCCSSFIHHDKK